MTSTLYHIFEKKKYSKNNNKTQIYLVYNLLSKKEKLCFMM